MVNENFSNSETEVEPDESVDKPSGIIEKIQQLGQTNYRSSRRTLIFIV